MQGHTPEPWVRGKIGDAIVAATYADGTTMESDEVEYYGGGALVCESCRLADIRRILACVAFCRGLSTEAIELCLKETKGA